MNSGVLDYTAWDIGAVSYGRNKFSPSSTGQIFTYSVFDKGYVDTDAVGKGWYVTDSCGIK